MSNLRVIHPTSVSITPEQARDARARAWAYIFDCHAKKKTARPGGPDDTTKGFRISEKEKGGTYVEH
jgi:hypothetical protein